MRARTLGRTGLPVTPLGIGLAAVGRPAYITLGRDADLGGARGEDDMRRRAHEVLDAAYRAGVRYVDAARSYGLAEEFLASWLDERGLSSGEVTVGSKWGYTYTAGWRLDADVNEVKDHSLAALRRQYRESRAALGDRLALYQVHSATLETGVLDDAAVLAELARLREDGVAVGLTVSGPRQADVIRRALDVRVDGVNPLTTVQATWNVLEPSAGQALAEAHEAGFGVIVKEALANGRLTVRGGDLPRPLRDVARRLGAPADRLALAAALANPWADVVLSGAATPAHVASNAAAVGLALPPLDEAAARGWAEPSEAYWSHRATLRWE